MTKTEPLSVPDAIRVRRTTKRFKPDPISETLLKELVTLTLAAPSSHNQQPWRIVIVDDPAQKAALGKASYNQAQITTAPVTFVFAVSIRGWEKTLDQAVDMASEKEAWPEKAAQFIRSNVPRFQDSLGDKQREYAIKDAIIAATHLALAAESLGLNSCFMNGWIEEDVKEVIGVRGDTDIAIALLLPIGYGESVYTYAGRLPEVLTVFRNRMGPAGDSK